MKNKELKEVTIYFLITIFLSLCVFWGPIALFKIPTVGFKKGAVGPLWAIIPFMIGGFIPSIVGIILTAVFEGKTQVKQFLKKGFQIKIGLKMFIGILLSTSFYAVALIIIYSAIGGRFDYSAFLTVMPTLIPLLILGPLSEEYGWRGFALKRLLKIVSPNLASLILGIVWSLWHLPLFHAVGTNQYEYHWSFLNFTIIITSLCFIFTYFYIKTNENLFTAVLIHWIYTSLSGVVSAGIVRTSLYSSLEFIPAIIIGLVFAFMLYKEKTAIENKITFNK